MLWQAVQHGPTGRDQEMLFADDAKLKSQTEEGTQRFVNMLAYGCTNIGLKKTNVMGQEVSQAPVFSINDHTV